MSPPCQALRSPPSPFRASPSTASRLLPSSSRALAGGHRHFLPHVLPMVLTAVGGGDARRRTASPTCMANPRRVKMVAKQIWRELSDMLLTDTVLQHAVLPEASLGADRYLSSLTTITDVEISGDLQVSSLASIPCPLFVVVALWQAIRTLSTLMS